MDELHAREAPYPQDLVRHVAMSTGLDEATASRVVADVMAYFGQIRGELRTRRFRAPDASERQLRRMVYG